MGTNYYLRKKAIYTPRKDRDDGWYENYDFDFYENEYNKVLELTNGYVFNNTYYMDLKDLNKHYYLTYHIGKNSAGWRFTLASYPKLGISTIEDWNKLFYADNTSIYDEYDRDISPKEMLDLIKYKEPDKSLLGKSFYKSSDGNTYSVKNGLLLHTDINVKSDDKYSFDMLPYADFC